MERQLQTKTPSLSRVVLSSVTASTRLRVAEGSNRSSRSVSPSTLALLSLLLTLKCRRTRMLERHLITCRHCKRETMRLIPPKITQFQEYHNQQIMESKYPYPNILYLFFILVLNQLQFNIRIPLLCSQTLPKPSKSSTHSKTKNYPSSSNSNSSNSNKCQKYKLCLKPPNK